MKDIIHRNTSTTGNCDYCKSQEVLIYNPRELNFFFQNILNLYEINEKGSPIDFQIEKDFTNKIFSSKVNKNIKELLQEIIADDFTSYQEIFNNPVILSCINNPSNDETVKPLQITWERFADEIKSVNRFHLQNVMDLEKLKVLLSRYENPITKGRKFYRARISSKDGFSISEMGHPPADRTKSGRANPLGISYLYLADQVTTTLYEARASLFDYVAIGDFRLKEDIKVINLRGNSYDPIVLAEKEDLEDFLIHLPFISKLESTLSKPKRRDDNELDYLPTQYLSEYIKSIGYDGVMFQSSLYSQGYNLAIFNPEKFECIKVGVYEIDNINFNFTLLT
ncbi:RES domain-containing protein [Adhaeribacter pallidiroseus]|uniref:RES domain-containing protein n=1 Tax=Adhaeribacter pallidiroseus TaxID=2072847 RepID=UPI00131416E4|nr:RES domain-containing protein [Adhaeribacter pallidiroseus]